jgi:uncharacterized tellurite resistance protein B-like protein
MLLIPYLPEELSDSMDALTRKKINLLVHLARIDGQLDVSEQDMLHQLLKDHEIAELDWKNKSRINLDDYKNVPSKSEILFLALRMIRADGIIHPDEVAYCKALAIKLDFNPEIIDHYSHGEFPTLIDFKNQINRWHQILKG